MLSVGGMNLYVAKKTCEAIRPGIQASLKYKAVF